MKNPSMIWMLLPAVCMTVCSCAPKVRQADVNSVIATPKTFSLSGEGKMPDKWWTVLGDAELDKLIAAALKNNLDLIATWDRLAEARAAARRSDAGLYPTLTGDGGASRTRTETHKGTASPLAPFGRVYTSSFSLGMVAAYEVDLWGRVRSTSDAAGLDVLVSMEDLDAAAITLTAEVAQTWYRLLESRLQLKLLDSQIETSEQVLKFVELRRGLGEAITIDRLQQQQQVESKRAEKARTHSRRMVLEHQLAVLLGKAPGAFTAPQGPLPAKLPELPATGLSADLIRRRPDVRSAQFRVAAANKRVAAAIADRFPRVSLSLQAGSSTAKVRDLFDNWFATLAANLTAPILDGDLRAAEVSRTRAVASRQLHTYAQKILTAIKEVEDALAREARQRQYIDSLAKQLAFSKEVVTEAQQRYRKADKKVDYLRTLDALQSHQRLQRTSLLARRELIDFRIGLYRALAGSVAGPAGADTDKNKNEAQK
ncbi:MAG: TolC family protein [Phycisphaerae bacterium]|jgi:NodT family efflux transporter outer membrane factor (OMF) lipoprotein|nr:TolC family protein [Phycisphaerae bacterium]